MDEMTEMLTRIETKLDVAIGRVEDHEIRLRSLESRSGKRWENLVSELLRLTLAAGTGFLLAQIGL